MNSSSNSNGPASEPTAEVLFGPLHQPFQTNSSLNFHTFLPRNQGTPPKKPDKTKKPGAKKTLVKWVDLFTCFLCGKEGRSPPLRRCSQCEIAYYCTKTCQRGHWKQHKAACIAAVAAKADDARRERLARAVREKGKDRVEGGEDDALCVICLGPPVDPVQVRVVSRGVGLLVAAWLVESADRLRKNAP